MQPIQRLKQESNLKQARHQPPPSLLLAMNFNLQIAQLTAPLKSEECLFYALTLDCSYLETEKCLVKKV
jgi:hypothetical protein